MDYSGFSYGPSKGSGSPINRGGSVPRSVAKFQERQSPSPHATAPAGSTPSPTHVAGRMRVARDFPKGTLDDVAAANAALQYSALVNAGGLVDASVPKRSHWQTSYAVDGYGVAPHGLVDASAAKRSHWQTSYAVDSYGVPHMERLGTTHGAVTEESAPAAAGAIFSHYGISPSDAKNYITSANSFYHTATPSQAYFQAASGKTVMPTREDYQNLYKTQGYAAAALYPAGYTESLALASGALEGYDARAAYNAYASAVNGAVTKEQLQDARAAYNAYASAVNGAVGKEHIQGSTRSGDERYVTSGYGGIPAYTQSRESYPGVASSYATPRRGGGVSHRF